MHFLIGTRASNLAVTQSRHVAEALSRHGVALELHTITTQGDVDMTSLSKLGGIGVFAATLRQALLAGDVDLAVHSFKDLPTAPVTGLTIAAIPAREDPRDVLVSRHGLSFADLPPGASIGTGSPRRAAQIRHRRPDLTVVDIRGNVPTRIARALSDEADLDAVVLAAAGLARLGLTDVITEYLDFAWAPAQGALAIETRIDPDPALADVLTSIHDDTTAAAVTAERAVLAGLQAGCAAPVGVTHRNGVLTASVFASDGSARLDASCPTPSDLSAAHKVGLDLADQLIRDGANTICDLGANKPRR